ncbi:MAG TPA: hypothetical protein VJ276_00115, partial [Thermoanaerobaculia bacterium]|nr:hypothetical protein [Thermoanaerobaculia bacterium]
MNILTPFLILHIAGAVIGLLSGFLSIFLRKGSGMHAAAGTVFFVSMICMTSSAAYIAAFLRPNSGNLVVAVLTFYLVTTAWVTARRRDGSLGLFDWAAMLVVLADGAMALIWGFQAAASPTGTKFPAAAYFIFGSFAMVHGLSDVRMLRRGSPVGGRRIARHLWRMCFALLITTFSLYPGQARLFPPSVRATNLLFVPHILLLGSMLFWLVRVRRTRAEARRAPAPESTGAAWGGA